ncbi:MAG TPA: 1-deoxy-D-xylulose-5-phosphate reductoisomerase [Solirubrobacterales bacterium]|nr:1-deoxy-D-xylulose-5-phosphate reductoisomerase [Solirubrobacterales bacterium]
MKRLVVLGSTGSIGTQALQIVADSDDFEVVGLVAGSNWQLAVEQARAHDVPALALAGSDAVERASAAWDGRVLAGGAGIQELIASSGANLVLNGIVGAAGLGPTVVALGEGIDLALANKESLVIGGELVTQLAEATGAAITPVDSEHTALHQLASGQPPGSIDRLVITASGGPFRGRSLAELEGVTVADALNHPTWAMGGKITIDSATLMNKGLEVMEAHHLFGTPYEQIDVVVHPQSLVHGLVQLADRAMLAHIGPPDMRVAISYAMHGGSSVDLPIEPVDLTEVGTLSFEPVDEEAFPALGLARQAALAGGTAPCVLNAANEVAVHAFLEERVPFTAITAVIESVLEEMPARPVTHFDDLFAVDSEARQRSAAQIEGLIPA